MFSGYVIDETLQFHGTLGTPLDLLLKLGKDVPLLPIKVSGFKVR